MVDTVRSLSALQALLADNTSGDISAQDVRDMLVSVFGIHLIETITLASTTAVTFNTIPAHYQHLVFFGRARSARVDTDDGARMRLGTGGTLDTGSNYSFFGNYTGISNQSSNASTELQAGRFTAANATAGFFAPLWGFVGFYATTGITRPTWATSGTPNTTETAGRCHGQWLNTTDPVQDLSIYGANANLVAGTRISLYGIGSP